MLLPPCHDAPNQQLKGMAVFGQAVNDSANLDTYSAQMGFASTGVRILGSVLALLISVLANNPQWLFITMISRVFIELGDAVVGLLLDGVTANTGALAVLAAAEVWAVSRLWQVIKRNP